jgi:hypothetical protein
MKTRVRHLAIALASLAGVAALARSVDAATTSSTRSAVDVTVSVPTNLKSPGTAQTGLHLILRLADGSTAEFTGTASVALPVTSTSRTGTTYEGTVTVPVRSTAGGTGDADLYLKLHVPQRSSTGDADLYVRVTATAEGTTTPLAGSSSLQLTDDGGGSQGSGVLVYIVDTGIA